MNNNYAIEHSLSTRMHIVFEHVLITIKDKIVIILRWDEQLISTNICTNSHFHKKTLL